MDEEKLFASLRLHPFDLYLNLTLGFTVGFYKFNKIVFTSVTFLCYNTTRFIDVDFGEQANK